MTYKTTCRLLLAVCVLGTLIWGLERSESLRKSGGNQDPRVLSISPEEAEYLTLEKGDLRVDLKRERAEWMLISPLHVRANSRKVAFLLHMLADLKKRETITEAQRDRRELGLADYGLVQPRARVVVGSRTAREEILIGDDAPLGDVMYVKVTGNQDVVGTSKRLLDVFPETVDDLRDRSVFTGSPGRVAALEIQRPGGGFIQVTRSQEGWRVQQPFAADAEDSSVRGLLEYLYDLQVASFIWDAADTEQMEDLPVDETGSRLQPYGLASDEASLMLTIRLRGEETAQQLIVGNKLNEDGSLVYAKKRGVPTIFAISADILRNVSLLPADLRQRTLFPVTAATVLYLSLEQNEKRLALSREGDADWVIIDPVHWDADDEIVAEKVDALTRLQASRFVDILDTDTNALGFTAPEYVVTISNEVGSAGGGEKKIEGRRLLINPSPTNSETVVAMLEHGQVVFETDAAELRNALGSEPVEPLRYRDRTVLSLPPADIRRLVLRKGDVEQAVARDEAGGWVCSSPEGNVVDDEAVARIVALVSDLKALRIEGSTPDNVAAYGLDRSLATLTVGLSGKTGIQKSLILGFRAKTDGIYAMVQGQDIIFVLETEVAEQLMSNITAPQAP